MSKKEGHTQQPKSWLALPVIATVARLLTRERTLQNEYFRVENRILRSKIPGRVRFTDEERFSLAKAAIAMGSKLMHKVVSIVKPQTILAWQRRLQEKKWDFSERRTRTPGRPRVPHNIEAIVCTMARENTWGYKRIKGELAKLGITLSASCIANVLRRNSLPPSPERKGLTWREFLSRHADQVLCADLFTQEVWSVLGLRTADVLFVIHLRTRAVLLAEATFSPNNGWMRQQARNLFWECEDNAIRPRLLLHDNDSIFSPGFDAVLGSTDVTPLKTPFQAPSANPHAERYVRSLRQECLNHFIFSGIAHLQRTIDSFQTFFNTERPHQGIGNRIPERIVQPASTAKLTTGPRHHFSGPVRCKESLGGLLKSYYREAA